MLVTVTNVTAATINDLDSISGGTGPSSLLATGGARKTPLPYPFGHIGALAASGTKQLSVHSQDMLRGGPVSYAQTLSPGQEWNQLVQGGIVTLTLAAETTSRDTFDLMVASV